KKKNSHHKNLVPNCSKLSRKVVQNCAKIVHKIRFSKSPEIAAAARKKKFGAEIPSLLKTTNKQTNKQTTAGAERRRNCNVAKCGEMCKQNVLIQAEKKKKKKAME
ncbi:unnamed protein product, partial [Sphagnum troendelagicum]